MVVIEIFGTSDVLAKGQLQAITTDLSVLCQSGKGKGGYISFPLDRYKADPGIGIKIVALICLADANTHWAITFGERVRLILEKHLPRGTPIGIQLIEAKTVSELTKEP